MDEVEGESLSESFRRWNGLGLRAAYGQMLFRLAGKYSRVVAVSADLGRSSGLDKFSESYPERYFGVGIAEQNMVGFASGFADQGFAVFCSSFAPFIAFRAAEQVRMNLGYMQAPVNLVAMASGFSLGFLGSSHYGLEDIAVMRAIDGIEIHQPADASDLWFTLQHSIDRNTPKYIRLTGGAGLTQLYRPEASTASGGGLWLTEPSDVIVLSSGVLSATVQRALTDIFHNLGQKIGHFHVARVRPLSSDLLDNLDSSSQIIVVEEHSISGGLGDELKNLIPYPHKVIVLGIEPGFPHGASYETQLKRFGLDQQGLYDSILAII